MKGVIRSFLILSLVVFSFVAVAKDAAYSLNIAVVNMQELLAKYNKVKLVNKQLAAEKDKRQAKLDKRQMKLKRMKESLDKRFKKLSEKNKKKEARKLERELMKLQKYHDDLMGDLREIQAKKYKALEDDIVAATKRVARAKKIEMVLEKGVVFVGGRDITSAVLKQLNK